MKVATKLAAAFGLLVMVLGAVLAYHVRTTRNLVTTGDDLAQASLRLYNTAISQSDRITQLEENAAKYWLTRDGRYAERFKEVVRDYETELRHLDTVRLSERERFEATALANEFAVFRPFVDQLEELEGSARDSIALRRTLDSLRAQTGRLSDASEAANGARSERAAAAAREAERLSWVAGGAVVILSVLISALILRSISERLNWLKEGTREVARGRFDYRLDTNRGDEFAQVGRDFNIMTERLGELDAMKRDFISKVSHDLKTPLASMQETIDILLDELPGPLTEKQQRLLRLNYQSGQRLSGMLSKLLDMASLEAGMLAPQRHVLDLVRLVQRAIAQKEPTAELLPAAGAGRHGNGVAHSSSIINDLPLEPILLEADADRILQVLDNLIDNALKFSPPLADIELKLHTLTSRPPDIPAEHWRTIESNEPAGTAAHITVADRGPGIVDEHKERIFERFYQTAEGRGVRGRGVGLGLTICREIVTAHSGSIWVTDRAGGGSVFHLLLPGAFRVPPRPTIEVAVPAPEPVRS
ncbi:MAG: ATP-binding protein [Longimicrobiales bacterium]